MSMPAVPAALSIAGLPLMNLALDESIDAIECALASDVLTRIAFINADCINQAASNAGYRQDLANFDWLFIDGIGMRIAGNALHQPVRANVNGTDLFRPLCKMLARTQRAIYLLGAKPGVATATAQWAAQHYPGLRIAGSHHGYFQDDYLPAILADIRQSRADVLLVAMGAPKQEAWIRQHFSATGVRVAIGVGGLFDYYAKRIPRAPPWMRRCGMEWVFRLVQEPRRLWRRYLLGNIIFLCRLPILRLKQAWHTTVTRHLSS